MKTCPVIVIGHVDHGKTSLVRALTGIETDKLPEEQARGLSITVGFAYLQCGETMIDFIDAPGHENFIRAMVSGASGARSALLVISVTEGVQAQTREHIAIVEALGLGEGIVALTKADLLSVGERAGREAELRADLAGTRFHDAPMVFCSAMTGEGLQGLQDALAGLGMRSRSPRAPLSGFLPVDRVFVADGHGTVVTGTLLGGSLKPDDQLVLASTGQLMTVRRIQVRGQDAAQANPGERTALNLRGVSAGQIKPGDVVHAPGAFAPSMQCDAVITVSNHALRPVRHMEEIRVLYGTGHSTGRLRLLDGQQVGPGHSGFAQLRFTSPICTFAGQRLILRSLSPAATLGGAVILDPAAAPSWASKALRLETLGAAHRGDAAAIAAALASENQGIACVADISRLARVSSGAVGVSLGPDFALVSEAVVSPVTTIESTMDTYLASLKAYHAAYPLKPFAPRLRIHVQHAAPALTAYVEAALAAAGTLVLSGTEVALADHAPLDLLTAAQRARMDSLADTLRAQGLAPPGPDALIPESSDGDLIALLVRAGTVIHLNNVSLKQAVLFHADSVTAAVQSLQASYPGQAAFTTGEARATLNTSRKCIVPLLEYLDTSGITHRAGNTRYIV